MVERFAGKVTVVTGGASGIGRAVAERLAREGARVLVADVDEAGGAAVAAAIRADGGAATFRRADVSVAAEVAELVAQVEAEEAGLDVLVNSAGIGAGAPVAELTEAMWDQVLSVNLKGTFLCCRAAFPALVRRGGGVIVNLASLAALAASPGFGAYGAAKAGVVQLTRVLAVEGAGHRVRANALCPAWVATPMLQAHLAAARDPEAAKRRLASMIPLRRLATVDDVAAAALFLASDEASFITGVALPIDGGMSCG